MQELKSKNKSYYQKKKARLNAIIYNAYAQAAKYEAERMKPLRNNMDDYLENV